MIPFFIQLKSIFVKQNKKNQWRPCIILLNESALFPKSPTLFQAFKDPVQHKAKVWSSNINCLCKSAYLSLPRNWCWEISLLLYLLHCYMMLASSLHHVFHCNWGPVFNSSVAESFQCCIISLFWVSHEFNICFTKCECTPYDITAFLNIFTSNISTGSQLTLSYTCWYLSLGGCYYGVIE